jgi:3'-5' exoribonuclease
MQSVPGFGGILEMKAPYAAELQPNEMVTAIFLVQSKDVRQKKSGEPFLSLILADRTGDIDAKMWDNVSQVLETFGQHDFVKVKGVAQIFQNKLQFTIHSLTRLNDSDVDLADYFPASLRDPAEMFAELRGVIAGLSNPHLRQLLERIFDDASIASKFQRAPAAKTIHHAWLGGLLEHVLSLCTLCRAVGPHYPSVDVDLLLTGAILHDLGKIDELTYDRGFGYSDAGQLLGHILIGLRMVQDKLALIPDFPPALRMLVEHLIVSHHGELAFGSPKVPMTQEAMLLHHLDNLDSKMETMRGAVAKDKLQSGNWTSYVSSIERTVLKSERFLNPPVEAAQPAAAPRPAASGSSKPATVMGDKLQLALKGS